jgi:hypothetical protein
MVLKAKLYTCEVPGCGRTVPIRSTIKSGELVGTKCCGSCKSRYDKKKVVVKRKEIDEDLEAFFADGIKELTDSPICENCSCKINVGYNPRWNIAHILPKSIYKSVKANKDNLLFLCTQKDNGNFCHETFDSTADKRTAMPVFKRAKEKFELFKNRVSERGHHYFELV